MAYIIKITHRVTHKPVKHGYYSLTGTFTQSRGFSRVFENNIQAINHANTYKMIWPDDDVYIINEENDIGTYFSTYAKERAIINAFTKITLMFLLPVIIPIEGCMKLKEYTVKLIGK